MVTYIKLVHARSSGLFAFLLLAGGNWNNGLNAGPSYRNTNNTPSNSNRNISTHLELRYLLGGLEQRTNQNPVNHWVKHTTNPQMGASISLGAERSHLLVRLWGVL
jgi:hypothetical protein